MKKLFCTLLAVAAMAFGAGAQAADSLTYKDTSGKVFSIEDVRKIEYDGVNSKIVLTYQSGASTYGTLTDNGTVFAKIKLDHPEFLTKGTTVLYVQKKANTIGCDSYGTNFGWRNSGAESVNDGCALATQAGQSGKVNNP